MRYAIEISVLFVLFVWSARYIDACMVSLHPQPGEPCATAECEANARADQEEWLRSGR